MLGHCEFAAAVLHGDPQYLQQIFTEYPDIDVNAPIIGKSSALYIAAEKRYTSLIEPLIARGADINAKNEKGLTPLQRAFDSPLIVYYLLKENVDISVVYNNTETVLHSVIRMDNVGLVRMILARGGDPTLRDNQGDTALSLAIRGYPEVAEELLLGSTYVDPNISAISVRCTTPLLSCLKRRMFSAAKALVHAGYRGSSELEQYHLDPSPDPQHRRKLTDQDKAARKFFEKSCEIMPLSLQRLAHLAIRRDLKTDIHDKINRFPHPQFIKDYLLFKEIYQPLDISTDEKAIAYMKKQDDLHMQFGFLIHELGD